MLTRPVYSMDENMNMNHPNRALSGCAITGLKSRAPDFSAIASSLSYQSAALGMEVGSIESCPDNAAFSFEFKTPLTAPVACKVTRWRDPSKHASVTENIMQAACGLMSVHGRAGGKARPLGLNYVSTLTAALALQGGAAAAIGQLRGCSLSGSDVSMACAALLSVGQYIAGATAPESPETLLPGCIPDRTCPPFVSLDGVVFELETLDAEPWRKFWSEIGVSPAAAGKGWTAFLLRYAKAIAPLPDELRDAISKFSYHCISQVCVRTGMSICPVRTVHDRARDEDCRHVWFQGPWEFAFEMNPSGGALARASGNLPLSGITVVESCRRIQGPLAGHLLALLGATVIRIEPPGGDPLRGMPPMAEGCSARFDALNRLKIIREVDIKSPAGRTETKELARQADVFLHNWAPGKAVLLNLDEEDLAAVNPSLIYAYAAGWATDRAAHSPLNSMPGTDFMAQAYSGVARKIAETTGAHGGSLFTVLDVLGGVVAAQGITIALLNRCMNKAGARVTSSLMSAAGLLCAADFQRLYGPPGPGPISKSIIDEVYETRHGKIAIECCDMATVVRLAEALELAIDGGTADFEQNLDELFLSRTAEEWAEILEQAGIPSAVVIEDLADLQTISYLRPSLDPGAYTQVNSPWSFR
jgi:crotonobetainyl-CoA:carnitine CoA-transferase CaiB-like acyl-CoA transferase